MGLSESRGRLNTSSLQFPSDGMTLRQMRMTQPDLFTPDSLARVPAADICGIAVHALELAVALKAFAQATGSITADPYPHEDSKALDDALVRAYVQSGLSPGPVHAAELVRDLRIQVSKLVGQNPPGKTI